MTVSNALSSPLPTYSVKRVNCHPEVQHFPDAKLMKRESKPANLESTCLHHKPYDTESSTEPWKGFETTPFPNQSQVFCRPQYQQAKILLIKSVKI